MRINRLNREIRDLARKLKLSFWGDPLKQLHRSHQQRRRKYQKRNGQPAFRLELVCNEKNGWLPLADIERICDEFQTGLMTKVGIDRELIRLKLIRLPGRHWLIQGDISHEHVRDLLEAA